MTNYAPGPRAAAVLAVLTRRWNADAIDLAEARRRVDMAQAADNARELRAALVDESAKTLRLIEELEPPSEPE